MSLSHSILAARAPAPFSALFRRQTESEEFQCVLKKKTQIAMDCPKAIDPITKCATGGIAAEDVTEDMQPYSDKESCIEMCNIINNGDIIRWSLACAKDQCENYKDFEAIGEAEMKKSMDELYMPICKEMGLTEVTSSTKGSSSSTKTTAGTAASDKADSTDSAKDAKATDDAEKEEDEQKDAGSGAGLVRGWKGASVVAALAFGSLFML